MVDLEGLGSAAGWLGAGAPPSVRVVRGGCLTVEDRWQGAELVHPDLGFYLVDAPGMVAEAAGRRWPYVAGAVTMIPPWWRYTYRFRPGMGHAFLHVEVASWPAAVLRKHLREPVVLRRPDLVAVFRRCCALLLAGASAEAQHLAAQHSAVAAVAALTEALPALAAEVLRHGGAWRHLRPALELVEARLAGPLGVADLGAALGCSRGHAARLFARHLGQSPVLYLQERRVARAVALMHDGASVAEAAHAVGVGTPQYLARLVRRHLGQAPTALVRGR